VANGRCTQFYTAPTAIRTLMRFGPDVIGKYDLSSLRVLGTVGEPINPEAWRWYFEHVGRSQITIVDTWWQTETGGHMMTPLPGVTPMKVCGLYLLCSAQLAPNLFSLPSAWILLLAILRHRPRPFGSANWGRGSWKLCGGCPGYQATLAWNGANVPLAPFFFRFLDLLRCSSFSGRPALCMVIISATWACT
jgi:hypothetical protein